MRQKLRSLPEWLGPVLLVILGIILVSVGSYILGIFAILMGLAFLVLPFVGTGNRGG